MKAFLLSIVVLLLIVAGARFGLKPLLETPSAVAYSTDNVRLD
ncbi:hypothetical protein SAMN05877838_3358 [Hoeflea halophila]|uniref:Uncharacterized protein n=1 Tax=Hoeflea halophila TaxID=714899 RepID=A0A286IGH9_9HYPH|nr:hypothetical protein [Hoeflea halophila]SOE18434.1 hypothetical protein SAMN05877838_3358 [Hoeflea halophila]